MDKDMEKKINVVENTYVPEDTSGKKVKTGRFKEEVRELDSLRTKARYTKRKSFMRTKRHIFYDNIAPKLPKSKRKADGRHIIAQIVQYGEKEPGKVQLNIQPFYHLKDGELSPGKRTSYDLETLKWIRDHDIINQAIYLIETLPVDAKFK